MVCRACGSSRRLLARNLCWSCYGNLDIRRQFPSTSKFAPCGDEPSAEEVEQLVNQQRQHLPEWWWDSLDAQREGKE